MFGSRINRTIRKNAKLDRHLHQYKKYLQTCFGAPFMPLQPTKYAEMLSKKIKEANTNVWLINTGWTGGKYGIGRRIPLKQTRAMINALQNLENVLKFHRDC